MKIRLTSFLEAKKLYLVALHVIIVVLASEVVFLMKQNETLKERHDMFAVGSLKEGDAFKLEDLRPILSVNSAPLERPSRQLIFVFSTRCRFCKSTIAPWTKLAKNATKANLGVMAVSMDSMPAAIQYLKDNPEINYSIYVPNDIRQFAEVNRLSGVPITLIRSELGVVEKFWVGSLDSKMQNDISNLASSR